MSTTGFVRACILAAVALGGTWASVWPSAAVAAPMPATRFPHEQSAFTPDPAARYGRLANGFTYIIQKNANPAGTAQIYLRIGAGSMMETDRQRGLAHFIEHMAFNGSTHIPRGDLKKILERDGFTFGADANAFTSEAQTVYTLSSPKNDAETIDSALFILRDIAGDVTLDPKAIDEERGVILSEERLRDTAGRNLSLAVNGQLYSGTLYADRDNVIGSTDTIQTVSQAELAAFYHTWYRPDLATLIVVGDVDPAAIEAQIKARFATWTAATPAPEEPDWGTHKPGGLRTFRYARAGIGSGMALSWFTPGDTPPDSIGREVADVQETVLINLLNRRFQTLARDPDTSLVDAQLGRGQAYKTGLTVSLAIDPKPGKSRQAFAEAYGAFRAFLDQGVTADEVARIQAEIAASRRALIDRFASRTNAEIANGLLGAFSSGEVEQGLDGELKVIDAMQAALTKADLDARLKTMFTGDGPLLSYWGESFADFNETAMRTDYLAMNARPADIYKAPVIKAWPYADFGAPVAPASHTLDKDFAFSRYVFPNGVVLNVKPTKLQAQQVLVEVDFPGGILSLDPAAHRPIIFAQSRFLIDGGTGKLTAEEMRDALVGKRYGALYALLDNRAVLAGQTITSDLDTQLQVLMAYATDPGLRPEPFNAFKALEPATLNGSRADAGFVLGEYFANIMLSADPRYDLTGLERVSGVKFDDVSKVYTDSLQNTPITITIVGDVDEKTAVADIGKTFATLPKRPDETRRFPGADHLAFPPRQHDFTLVHTGRTDQNVSELLWPTTDFYSDTRLGRGLEILSGIMQNRLFDELRKAGADYSPSTSSYQDDDYPGYGYIVARATVKPGGDGDFRSTLARIAADLKTRPVDADELARAVNPILEQVANAPKSNAYWATIIPNLSLHPDARRARLDQVAEYNSITAADIMALAKTYLKDDASIHIEVVPIGSSLPELEK